jgi:uncharacterized protein involved in tellurium resistance
MAVTIAPSSEAMSLIVDQINSGGAYDLDVVARYGALIIDPLEEVTGLRVDVVGETEEQLVETLDVEDRSTHQIRIWMRKKVSSVSSDEIDQLKLIFRQIYQRVNNFDSSDGRVKVWDAEIDPIEVPIKSILQQSWLFVASLVLRVEVESS